MFLIRSCLRNLPDPRSKFFLLEKIATLNHPLPNVVLIHKMKPRLNFSFLLYLIVIGSANVIAQNTPCELDRSTHLFTGSPVEQARCLLRPNRIGGVLDTELKKLPGPLENIIGQKMAVDKNSLRKYLKEHGIDENALGGSLDDALVTANLPNGQEIPALYFIIHDTSWPYLKDEPFPAGFNTGANWKGNKIEVWMNNPVAHIFVNRLGRSVTTTPFAEAVRKGWGTKFARDVLKMDAKGLEIHIELIQPRRRDPANSNPENDRFAPEPGFTDAQYDRLALLYLCASLRRGSWLIPAYHSAIDAGIKDAHDDPQNFKLKKFAKSLKKLIKRVR